jgi:hypothetical protein
MEKTRPQTCYVQQAKADVLHPGSGINPRSVWAEKIADIHPVVKDNAPFPLFWI